MVRERSFCASLLPLTGNVEEIDGSKRKVKDVRRTERGLFTKRYNKQSISFIGCLSLLSRTAVRLYGSFMLSER